MGVLTPDDALWFGKYKGLSVKAIARFDPAYLLWVKRNLKLAWSDAALALAKSAWTRDYYQKLERQNGWAWACGQAVKADADKERKRRISIEHAERTRAGL